MIRRAAFAAALLVSIAPAVTPAPVGAQALPDAKTLMAKHNAAVGGREVLERHTSIHMVATMSMAAMGMEASMEMFKARPNKFVQKVVLGPVGEVLQGYDGKTAWSVNPMAGAQILEGEQLDAMKANADFFGNLQDDTRYTKSETLELTDFEGRKCYKVRLTREGRDAMQYFDAQTGLLAGLSLSMSTEQGTVEMTNVMTEWMDVGGAKFPKKIEQRTPAGPVIITFSSVEFDKVDPVVFDLPAAVKALVKP